MESKPNPTGWDIPKRYLRLRIYRMDSGVCLYELNEQMRIKFNTVASVSGALTEANVVISGLNVDSMFDISTATTQWMGDNWHQHRVVIQAGFYENYSTIFVGTILDAIANLNSADYTLTIKAISGFEKITTPQSGTYDGKKSVTKIASDLAEKNKMKLKDGMKDDSITIENFRYSDQSLPGILREIACAVPVDLYMENDRIYLKKRGEPLKNTATVTINSNMIVGVPQPTSTGCKVKVRMRQGLETGQNIKLVSAKYPQYNDTHFFLQTVAHSGDTFGSDWFTELELVKTGLGYGI